MESALAGTTENLNEHPLAKFLSPLPGLETFLKPNPRLVAVGYYRALLRN
jgi:hypothetical protein